MHTDNPQLSRALQVLRGSVGESEFELWCTGLQLLEVRDEVAILTAPTPFLCKRYANKYHHKLLECVACVEAKSYRLLVRPLVLPAVKPAVKRRTPRPIPDTVPPSSPCDRITLTEQEPADVSPQLEADATMDDMVKIIKSEVCEHLDVTESELIGRSRFVKISHARKLALFLAREYCPRSLNKIGKHFGGRDHTTILYSVNLIQALMNTDEQVQNHVSVLRAKIEKRLKNPE